MPPALQTAATFGIRYRAETDADLPFLARLYASTRADELSATGWPEAVTEQFLAQQLDAQRRHYRAHYAAAEWLLIEQSGREVGRLYLEESPSAIRIIDIALIPDARGGGTGGAILADLMAGAGRSGKSVSLHVERTNRALSLYRRLGFARTAENGTRDLMEWAPSAAS